MSEALFLEPLDVLYLRGNRLFGEGGDDAGAQMPPWPSVAAGAIRSRMLVDAGVNLHAFAKGEKTLTGELAESLGTPEHPGTFRLARFTLAKRQNDGTIEPSLPLPADWIAFDQKDPDSKPKLYPLAPVTLPKGIQGSIHTDALPVLRMTKADKASGGYWLTAEGIKRWLRGQGLQKDDVTPSKELWKTDARLGIAMEPNLRTADEGRIYTTDAVALAKKVGFLAEVTGADGLLPKDGLLRFGGDGRGAQLSRTKIAWPEPDWEQIARDKSFKLMLTSPGIFPDGWRLPGMGQDGQWRMDGAQARLVSASLTRAEVVSGWDVARHQPKAAQRAAPAGSVYWLKDFTGDVHALKALARNGLPCTDAARRAEGFNTCLIGNWQDNGKEK